MANRRAVVYINGVRNELPVSDALYAQLAQFDQLAIGASPISSAALNLQPVAITSGSSQFGIVCQPTFSSGATSSGTALSIRVKTDAAGYTMGTGYGARISNATKGSGSAITDLYGLYIDDLLAGSNNNYAIWTNSGFVRLGGPVLVGNHLRFGASSGYALLAAAESYFITSAWATGRGALKIHDGTDETYAVATLASSTPADGKVPTFNAGGTVTWKTPVPATPTYQCFGAM